MTLIKLPVGFVFQGGFFETVELETHAVNNNASLVKEVLEI